MRNITSNLVSQMPPQVDLKELADQIDLEIVKTKRAKPARPAAPADDKSQDETKRCATCPACKLAT